MQIAENTIFIDDVDIYTIPATASPFMQKLLENAARLMGIKDAIKLHYIRRDTAKKFCPKLTHIGSLARGERESPQASALG